jgi:hypothetical protein
MVIKKMTRLSTFALGVAAIIAAIAATRATTFLSL